MKRLLSFICLVLVCLSLSSCSQNAGTANNVVVSISKSTHFSKNEINSAVTCVTNKFKTFNGCELKKIWYDEKSSQQNLKGYISNGKGSKNGVKPENVIVLRSDFKVGSKGGDGSLNPNSTYSDWMWILIRNSKTGTWHVDDCGY